MRHRFGVMASAQMSSFRATTKRGERKENPQLPSLLRCGPAREPHFSDGSKRLESKGAKRIMG